jgi:O-antigen/teichoic acid export membrane protein
MIQVSAKGSLILVLGQMGSTLISAIGTILIARILGSTYFGVISIAYIPVNIALLLLNNGIGSAIIKYLAENRYEENKQSLRKIVLAGFTVNVVIGLLASISLYLLAGYIANQVFQIAELTQLIKILSVSVLAQSLLNTSYAVFVGYERMEIRSIVSMLYSVLKSVIGPVLVFLGYGVVGAAYGHTLPYLAAGIAAVFLVILLSRGEPSTSPNSFFHYVLLISRYSYPLFFSSLLSGSLNQILYFILPFYVSASIMGNFSAATNFSVLVTLFTTPLSTATFPLLSKLKPDDGVLEFVFQSIIKYESMIVFPVAAAVFALSGHLVEILYGATYPSTPFFIQILMLNYLFIGLGGNVVGNLLNSQKETKVTFQMTLIYLLIGAPMGLLLIPRLGVVGFQVTQMLAPKLGLFYALWWIKSRYRISVDMNTTFKITVSTLIGFTSCIIITNLIDVNPWAELMLGGGVLAVSYLLSILLTRALTRKNVEDIHRIAAEYKIMKRIVDPIFEVLFRLSKN